MHDLVNFSAWGPLTGVFLIIGTTLAVSSLVLGALLLYGFWSDHR